MRPGRALSILVVAMLATAPSSCTKLNDRPPTSILEVDGFGKGDATMTATFVLGDAGGRMTTADGTVRVTIFELQRAWAPAAGVWTERSVPLFTTLHNVHRSDFAEVRDPADDGRPRTILYSLGVLHYTDFDHRPTTTQGLVQVAFHTTDGRVLKGEDRFNF